MGITGFVYDSLMEKHKHQDNSKHPESPERIKIPKKMLKASGLLDKCKEINSRMATDNELELVHDPKYIQQVKAYSHESKDDVCKLEERWKTYTSDHTFEASSCAVGCVLNIVDGIYKTKDIENGIALVRPPGHHAEKDESCGFCFFNNIAIATKYAQTTYNVKKVLIIDWDIHHGNGIQHIFYEDPSVLYISLHRFDCGDYFPQLKEANYEFIGSGKGEGYNVNIPWNKDMMGNAEYKDAFNKIVLPIASEFQPDLVFVACGFDAVAADLLGEYVLTPDMYGYMTSKLKHATGNANMILSLEGGYNPTAIGHSLISCLEVLLGNETNASTYQDQTAVHAGDICKRAQQTIRAVVTQLSPYWKLPETGNS